MSKSKIQKLQTEIEDLQEAINAPGIPDDEKEVMREEINEIRKTIEKLVKPDHAKVKPNKKQKQKEKRKGRGRPPKDGIKKKPRTAFERKLEECRETLRKHRESKPRKEAVQHTRPKRLSDLLAKVFNLIAEVNADNAALLDDAQKDISDFHDKISTKYLGTEKPISPDTIRKMEKKIEKAEAA